MCGFLLTRREGPDSFTISAELKIGTEYLCSSFPPEIRTFATGADWSSFVRCSSSKYNITIIIVFVFNFLLTFFRWGDGGWGLCGGCFSRSLSGSWHWKKQHAYANDMSLITGSDKWHHHQVYLLTIHTHTNTRTL